ncbi:efflux transporter periplasmic adaptor subunit [Zavarzinia aquatilis]|uniref:Efflux transporter periplasmic adaptor subunit n=2 Tax=Zavarzinia aquatilis TaxID=2211142 RepID=A0A317EEA6_9PROT|nr:efflux transporter periplasmic adaptor subunit [Zavarzinia aquatilis]
MRPNFTPGPFQAALALIVALWSAPGLAQTRALPVEVAPVTVTALADSIEAVGSLRSGETVILRPEIAGRVSRILFEEGRPVAAGTPLVELDASTYAAQVAVARADLALAEAEAERARTLFAQRAGTARARDEAVARLATTKAALQLAEAQFAKTRILAPFGGILGLRAVSIGDVVQPGQTLVNLESIDPLKLDFAVPETMLARLAVGQAVDVAVDALPGERFAGTVYAIDPAIDEAGRAIRLRALVPNADGRLRPGLFARVRLDTARAGESVTVPEQALIARHGKTYVYKVIDGAAVETEVSLGRRLTGSVEVVAGLSPGDTVVVAGQQRLRDGVKIEVVAPDGTPAQRTGG